MKTQHIIGILLIILGIAFFFDLNIGKVLWPLFLIIVGWRIMSNPPQRHFSNPISQESANLNEVLIFTGLNTQILSKSFTGGKLVLVFAGGQLDLSQVKTTQDKISLEVVTVFGGLKLILPKDWSVQSESVMVVGGIDNKTTVPQKPMCTVALSGVSLFGGLEIVNSEHNK